VSRVEGVRNEEMEVGWGGRAGGMEGSKEDKQEEGDRRGESCCLGQLARTGLYNIERHRINFEHVGENGYNSHL